MGQNFFFPLSVAFGVYWYVSTKTNTDNPEYVFYIAIGFFFLGCLDAFIKFLIQSKPLKVYQNYLNYMQKEGNDFKDRLIPPINLTGEFLTQKALSWEEVKNIKLDYIGWRVKLFGGMCFALREPKNRYEGLYAPTTLLGNGYLKDQNQWETQLNLDLQFFKVFKEMGESNFSDRFLERPKIIKEFKYFKKQKKEKNK